jgi:benzodiazapine receptor
MLIGLASWAGGVALAIVVFPHSVPAAWQLLPCILWSPLGTLVTWQMQRLNR